MKGKPGVGIGLFLSYRGQGVASFEVCTAEEEFWTLPRHILEEKLAFERSCHTIPPNSNHRKELKSLPRRGSKSGQLQYE